MSTNKKTRRASIEAAMLKASQRPHKTRTGMLSKRPTERLKARRSKNRHDGYFPNPVAGIEFKLLMDDIIDHIHKNVSAQKKQLYVIYGQGAVTAAERLGVITSAQKKYWLRTLIEIA